MNGTTVCSNPEEMMALGESLAHSLPRNAVVLLHGPMGAGKTVLAKGIGRGLGVPPESVQSPTFTIVAEHRGIHGDLTHLDLYRLDPPDIEAIGIDEIVGGEGLAVIEWAERWPQGWPGAVEVEIRVGAGGERIVEVRGGMR